MAVLTGGLVVMLFWLLLYIVGGLVWHKKGAFGHIAMLPFSPFIFPWYAVWIAVFADLEQQQRQRQRNPAAENVARGMRERLQQEQRRRREQRAQRRREREQFNQIDESPPLLDQIKNRLFDRRDPQPDRNLDFLDDRIDDDE
ncbi:MAG: hypothetical protein SV186_04865 [Candidatus Nanohaloarchaea archaeon]|nr:hypothetical protein [Candidatus Nanohaloarchaea archaeon]